MRCFLKNIETILHTLHLIPHKFLFNKSIFPSVLSLPGTLLLTRVPSLIILGSENSADPQSITFRLEIPFIKTEDTDISTRRTSFYGATLFTSFRTGAPVPRSSIYIKFSLIRVIAPSRKVEIDVTSFNRPFTLASPTSEVPSVLTTSRNTEILPRILP